MVFLQSYNAFDLLGFKIARIYATIPHFPLEFTFQQIKNNFLISWHYKLLDSRESSISCFLSASTKQAKTWKPKTPATFQQTEAVIVFSALRSFSSARQIQRVLISFQLPNLLTSSFSFSLSRAFWVRWPISPLFQISAGTSGCYSQCPLNHKSFEDTGRHPPISRSKCNKGKSAKKGGAVHHCLLLQKW